MQTLKQKLLSLLNRLPDEFPIEDVQYHIYVIEKIHQGLETTTEGKQLKQEEAEGILGKWLIR